MKGKGQDLKKQERTQIKLPIFCAQSQSLSPLPPYQATSHREYLKLLLTPTPHSTHTLSCRENDLTMEGKKMMSSGESNEPTYLAWSIFNTIFCCTPIGIIALVFSCRVRNVTPFLHYQFCCYCKWKKKVNGHECNFFHYRRTRLILLAMPRELMRIPEWPRSWTSPHWSLELFFSSLLSLYTRYCFKGSKRRAQAGRAKSYSHTMAT